MVSADALPDDQSILAIAQQLEIWNQFGAQKDRICDPRCVIPDYSAASQG